MHISAVKAWERETGRLCDELLAVHCKGKGDQPSAFYSCRVDCFVSLPEWGLSVHMDELPPSPPPHHLLRPSPAGDKQMRRCTSDLSHILRPKHQHAFSSLCSSSASFANGPLSPLPRCVLKHPHAGSSLSSQSETITSIRLCG
jgi:hypothetical protein